MKPKEILRGPSRLRIELDASKIVPDDPGQDTPCLVTLGQDAASFNCASSTGELNDTQLTAAQCDWLAEQGPYVDEWLDHWIDKALQGRP